MPLLVNRGFKPRTGSTFEKREEERLSDSVLGAFRPSSSNTALLVRQGDDLLSGG